MCTHQAARDAQEISPETRPEKPEAPQRGAVFMENHKTLFYGVGPTKRRGMLGASDLSHGTLSLTGGPGRWPMDPVGHRWTVQSLSEQLTRDYRSMATI